jgi:ATP-dependent DNA helicase RecQ
VAHFLEQEYVPIIEKCTVNATTVHENGWALSYHGTSYIGKLVSLSKYANGGPFALSLVVRAIEIVRTRYPLNMLQGIVSVPSTTGNTLVDVFAQQVAHMLGLTYFPALKKIRPTHKQKSLTNRVQKEENMRDAFGVQSVSAIAGRTLLLIDDIYDSGYTLREAAKMLIQAGAKAVYPLTITRTYHSDNH